MKATILITGEKKENFLVNTISSCLKQNYYNYEIILLFSNLKNLNLLKKKFDKQIIFKKIFIKKKIQLKINYLKFQRVLKLQLDNLFFCLMEMINLKKIN